MSVATYDWDVLMDGCQQMLAEMSGDQAEAPQRDARGRFVNGNSGGPGRPPKPSLIDDDVVSLVAHCVEEVDWLAIATQAVGQAIQGDSAARNWLTRMLFG